MLLDFWTPELWVLNLIVVWVLPLCYHECKSFQTLLLCCAASSRCVFDAKWPRFVPGPPFTCPQLLLACKCIHVVSLLWFVLVQLILIQKNSVLYPCSSDNLCWTAFFRFIISLLNALRSFAWEIVISQLHLTSQKDVLLCCPGSEKVRNFFWALNYKSSVSWPI